MTTRELISHCFYDNLDENGAQEFIKRCYSLEVPITKIIKEYQQLKYMSGRN